MTFPFLVRLHKMRELKRNATMSRADFEAMKLAKFRKLARYVLDASPYYADLIAEREIDVDACVPADFPVLTKSIVMANFDRIVDRPPHHETGCRGLSHAFHRSDRPAVRRLLRGVFIGFFR